MTTFETNRINSAITELTRLGRKLAKLEDWTTPILLVLNAEDQENINYLGFELTVDFPDEFANEQEEEAFYEKHKDGLPAEEMLFQILQEIRMLQAQLDGTF